MKLINKFTIWYLTITTLVLLASGVIVYYTVEDEIDKEEARELRELMDHIANRLERGAPVQKLVKDRMIIRELDTSAALIPFHVSDTMAMHSQLQRIERHTKASISYKIAGKHYYISAYNVMVESDDIVDAIVKSLGWTFLILLLFVGLSSRLVSRQILNPFYRILRAIQSFNLKRGNLTSVPSRTKEFNELNNFLNGMTKKAVRDYQSLKEFTENASHELQTPLAIIRGKLELLMESKIDNDQANLILAAHNAVEKLSKLNQSLLLLTKLENQEYEEQQLIDLSKLLKDMLNSFHDLMEMKNIHLETNVEDSIHIRLNPALADILLTNLLSNAIRHNHLNGSIYIELSDSKFLISNTGTEPAEPTEQLFKRFKKNNQSNDSVGLGLSIVRQICDLNNFRIEYSYRDKLHIVEVIFT